MVGIGSDQVGLAVPVYIDQDHATVRITPNRDACGLFESAIPRTPEESDGLAPAVVHQEICVTITINVKQLHGMRMRGYVHLEPRGGPDLEAAPGNSEQQGHVLGVVVGHDEVNEAILVEIR